MTNTGVVPESHEDILHKKGFAHVATVGPHGEPQSSPVWYDWDGSELLFSNLTRRQKARNLRRDDRVAVSILDPDDPYRYLEIRGRARVVPDEGNAFINKMAKKYRGDDVYRKHRPGDERVVVHIRPEHVTLMG